MLLLYSGSSDIEVGPLLLKLQHIFDCLNSVLHPLVERTSEDLDGMLDVFVKCVVTRSRGPSNPSFGTGNPHFGPPVFRKRFVLCYLGLECESTNSAETFCSWVTQCTNHCWFVCTSKQVILLIRAEAFIMVIVCGTVKFGTIYRAQYKSFPENRGSEMRVSGSERRIGGAS